MSRLAYYVTAHGFGHGVRTCDILTKECGTYGLRITIGDRSCTDRILATLRTTALTV